MIPVRILAIVLMVGGVLALVYGSFTYPKESRETKLGPIELKVKGNQTIRIPVWVGAGAIAVGAAILLLTGRM